MFNLQIEPRRPEIMFNLWFGPESARMFVLKKSFQGYAFTPETYVASKDADAVSAKSFHESVDNMTKSASFPIDKDPRSSSMKLARAADIVYLSW